MFPEGLHVSRPPLCEHFSLCINRVFTSYWIWETLSRPLDPNAVYSVFHVVVTIFHNAGKIFHNVGTDQCFQLQIRSFLGFRFVPAEFDLPPFQLSVPEISRAFLEGPHDEKDVSTFVLAISTLFILHNNPIRSFGFVYLTIKNMYSFSLTNRVGQSPGRGRRWR